MQLTKQQLRIIIKEELASVMGESRLKEKVKERYKDAEALFGRKAWEAFSNYLQQNHGVFYKAMATGFTKQHRLEATEILMNNFGLRYVLSQALRSSLKEPPKSFYRSIEDISEPDEFSMKPLRNLLFPKAAAMLPGEYKALSGSIKAAIEWVKNNTWEHTASDRKFLSKYKSELRKAQKELEDSRGNIFAELDDKLNSEDSEKARKWPNLLRDNGASFMQSTKIRGAGSAENYGSILNKLYGEYIMTDPPNQDGFVEAMAKLGVKQARAKANFYTLVQYRNI